MPVRKQYLEFILEQLSALPALRPNRMFGGVGLYSDGVFFGLIDDDKLFFKTAESNIAPYRERGMPRFMPFPDRPEAVLGYHQVPADIIEDAEELVDWARQAVAVALSARARKAPKKKVKAKAKAKSTRARTRSPARAKVRARAKTRARPGK
jgi:DNA transformation protein